MIPRDYLTVAEAAEYCGLPPSDLDAQADALGFRSFLFMGVRLYRVCDLDWNFHDRCTGEYAARVDVAGRKNRKTEQERARRTAEPWKFAAKRAARRAGQILRTPAWADKGAINAFYQMAQRASRCTGLRFDVDHILPLHGETVSGLHVPTNLRVWPSHLNQSRGNRPE